MRYSGNYSRIPQGRGFLLLFFAGFLFGILFGCVSGKEYLDYAGILSEYYLNRYKYMELIKEQLFFYLVKERLFSAILLILFSFTVLGKTVMTGYLTWIGFSFGTLLTLSVIRFGGKGILLCIASMLPQYLLYVTAFLLLLAKISNSGIISKGKAGLVGNGILYLTIFLLLVAGVLLESWINPEIVQALLKIL